MRCKRSGISLAELMITMSTCMVLVSLTTVAVHRVMHHASASRTRLAVERQALRLAEAFRHDVHLASSIEVPEEPTDDGLVVRLKTTSAGQIEYRQVAGKMERLEQVPDEPLAREQFEFPAETQVKIVDDGAGFVMLQSWGPAADEKLHPRSVPLHLNVQARLGRDTLPGKEGAPE